MAEACHTARATTKQQVLDGVNKLTLQTNKHGQYTHDAILLLQKGIRPVLISQFNPSDPGKGMEKLLNDGDNLLTLVKSTDVITANYVIKKAKNRADKLPHSINRQDHPPLHHITSGGTGGSQPTERHQSIGYRRQRRCGQSHHQAGRQQRHRCHPPDGRRQQPQKDRRLHPI
jgi:hypothetical protein